MVQFADAIRTERVSTVNEDSGNSLSNVVLETTELANVEPSWLVVQLDDIHLFWLLKIVVHIIL